VWDKRQISSAKSRSFSCSGLLYLLSQPRHLLRFRNSEV
jgi:hypothetical protein